MREVLTVQVASRTSSASIFGTSRLSCSGSPMTPVPTRYSGPTPCHACETTQGITTYCPRLASVGSRGSVGSLCSSLGSSSAAADQPNIFTWFGKLTKLLAKLHERNWFLQSLSEEVQSPSSSNGRNNASVEDKDLVESLENGVKFWTDYSKVLYHPQSLYELYGSWTDFDRFDNYGTAKEVVSEWSQMEEMNES